MVVRALRPVARPVGAAVIRYPWRCWLGLHRFEYGTDMDFGADDACARCGDVFYRHYNSLGASCSRVRPRRRRLRDVLRGQALAYPPTPTRDLREAP